MYGGHTWSHMWQSWMLPHFGVHFKGCRHVQTLGCDPVVNWGLKQRCLSKPISNNYLEGTFDESWWTYASCMEAINVQFQTRHISCRSKHIQRRKHMKNSGLQQSCTLISCMLMLQRWRFCCHQCLHIYTTDITYSRIASHQTQPA